MENAQPHLERRLGLLNATSINMSNMVGAGIFITLPLILATMGGPQVLLGWVLGAAIAIADTLVWSELGAAFPGTGGSYVYLLNCFGRQKWGALLAFLFVVQIIASGPLEIASGNIGIGLYLSYLWPQMRPFDMKLTAAGVGLLGILLLYRKINSIARLMAALWIGMLATVTWVIVSGALHFNARLAFSFPPHAFTFSTGFLMGLGSATVYVMYCFLGYYAVCYLGDEVIDPARILPRSMIISVLTIAAIYCLVSVSIVGVVPWQQAQASRFIASLFMQKLYGNRAGVAITVLIIWTAFAASFALTLAYSRLPYAAARDGNFFPVFSRLHAKKDFPHYSLLLMGGLAVAASFFALDQVINALMAARILIQFIAQIVALVLLRSVHTNVPRPFKMFLYPVPAIVAFFGWVYVLLSAGTRYVLYGLLSLGLGGVGFLVTAKRRRSWPFAVSLESRFEGDPEPETDD